MGIMQRYAVFSSSSFARSPIRLVFCVLLAHQLREVAGRPANLSKSQAAFDALQVLASDFITHDVALFSAVQLLSRTSLVNAYHGDTNRPSGLADA